MTATQQNVVILEDDAEVRALIESAVASAGCDPLAFGTIRDFERAAPLGGTNLFLLDISLPDGDGLDIARQVRAADPQAGIIMITGNDDEVDTVLALEFGADDYVTKPFRVRELRARIKSVLRRIRPNGVARPDGDAAQHAMTIAGLVINQPARTVRRESGELLDLTTLEYDVLLTLARQPNRVLSRDQIMDQVRGPHWAAYDRTVDGIISRLRNKVLATCAADSGTIKTIRGVGYMFSTEA